MDQNPKQILWFGDSNTFGYRPNSDIFTQSEGRYGVDERATCLLQDHLGENYVVIAEGLNGRTTDLTGKLTGDSKKNGFDSLVKILPQHLPIEFLILQLGTNDLKQRFHRTAEDIALAIERIIQLCQQICVEAGVNIPRIIILSPPIVKEDKLKPPYRMKGAEAKSHQFYQHYLKVAKRSNAIVLNLAEIVESSNVDGLHLDIEAHTKIAEKLCEVILNLEA